MPGYPTPVELATIYCDREKQLQTLKAHRRVSTDDIRSLDRLGRARVATELWRLCDAPVREALLADAHPHVRSCAAIAARTHH